MATGYGQSGYGFVPQHPHPSPYPSPYPAGNDLPGGYAAAPGPPPPYSRQPSQAPYQQPSQHQLALQQKVAVQQRLAADIQQDLAQQHQLALQQQQAAAFQQQQTLQYQRSLQGQQPYPVSGGYTPTPYVQVPTQTYGGGPYPMSSYPIPSERPRRPTVTFEYTPREHVEGERIDYPQHHRLEYSPPRQQPEIGSGSPSRALSDEDHGQGSSSHVQMNPYELEPERGQSTDLDSEAHGHAQGYDLELWEPNKTSFILLGNTFDEHSLGKWIYDCTCEKYGGARQPLAEMAGELWTLLITLAGHVRRTEECLERVRREQDRDMMRHFIDSGHRRLAKLQDLLDACEGPMRDVGGEGQLLPHSESGIAFAETMFGHYRPRGLTEKLIQSFRTWEFRWGEECEPILPE